MYGLENAANWLLFGGLLLTQLGIFGDLFGSDDDDDDNGNTSDTPEPQAEDAAPTYVAANYSGEITGTDGDDVVQEDTSTSNLAYFMGAGNDTVVTTGTNDYVDAGSGNDTVTTQAGDDIIAGGAGDDRLYASHGDDIVHGQSGNDVIDGSLGNDQLYGGSGNDTISGAGGDDRIFGGSGNDTLSSDRLDRLDDFTRGTDTLDGGDGNDTLILGDGDTATGGSGTDTFAVVEVSDDNNGAARITDFDATSEQIRILYETRSDGTTPTASWAHDATTNTTTITVDGRALVTVNGNVTFNDSNLVLVDQATLRSPQS